MKTILEQIREDERASAIAYDLSRVHHWTRHGGRPYARRAPSRFTRLVTWLRGLFRENGAHKRQQGG